MIVTVHAYVPSNGICRGFAFDCGNGNPVDDCNHRGSVLYWTYDCSKNVVVYIMFRWQQIYGRGEGR